MKTYREKQIEHDLINKYLTAVLLKVGHNSYMDRGSLKYINNKDSLYRFKIKDRVIRKECQVTLSATEYSKASNTWILIRSYSYPSILKKANVWLKEQETISV